MERNDAQREGPERYHFKKLLLWQRAQDMALQVIKVTNRLPRTEAARSIARQLVASAGSVPANIAEGHGRFSRAAYRNHLSIARGSLWESEGWVDLLRRAEYIDVDAEEALAGRFDELTARLTSQMRKLDSALPPRGRIGEPRELYGETADVDENFDE